jgi:hypothetical protein
LASSDLESPYSLGDHCTNGRIDSLESISGGFEESSAVDLSLLVAPTRGQPTQVAIRRAGLRLLHDRPYQIFAARQNGF